jgi:predicted ATPase/class 3 adenylate cyclase
VPHRSKDVQMQDYPRGTVTFLFTDIEGSTRLWQDHHLAMTRAYVRHDAIFAESIAGHGGVRYKTIGDAFQVAFATAASAVAAAFEIQQALTAESWELSAPLRVRMALHTGAVDPDPHGDYRSPVLNRLGRLLGAGYGGQVLLSQATMELCRDSLPAGATLSDLGEQRLKDLFRPERVYQLGGAGLLEDFPALKTLDYRPNNLTAQPTPLVGREAEVSAVQGLLARDDVRLVTLTGTGGTGKTRLGLQVAADSLDTYADGVYFVDLSALTDPGLVSGTIANTLRVPEDGERSPAERLTAHLREKRLLLVLDNFEHVTGAARLVSELLANCPGLKVLVTSRIRLQLRGERTFPVPPLALPDPQRMPSLDVLTQYEAVRLFLDRAQEHKPDFTIDNDNAPAISEICVRLDGLPLAIELAAARVRMLPPEAMLRRLVTRLPMLKGGAHDLPARQQTLRGAIAWSHDLLTAEEQALFRRLASFRGGCTLEAVEAVAGDDATVEVFDGLERLVDHSLLRQTETSGEPRFAMLETIREFGMEQLEASSEADDIHRRHAGFFAALAAEYLDVEEMGPWMDRMEADHDNLRATCDWALTHDLSIALGLVGPITQFSAWRGYLEEALAWLERVLAHCGPDAEVDDRLLVHRALSYVALLRNDLDLAWENGTVAATLLRSLDKPKLLASTLSTLVSVASGRGDTEQEIALSNELAGIAGTLEDEFAVSGILNTLGYTACQRGELDQAWTWLTESLRLARKIDDDALVTNSLQSFADLCRARGEIELAESSSREGLMRAWEGKVFALVPDHLESLAILAALKQQEERAARLFGAEEAVREETGYPRDPSSEVDYLRHLELTKDALGEEAFAAAYAAGAALPVEDAIREALAEASA